MTVIVFFFSYFTEYTDNITSSQFSPLTKRKADFSKGPENIDYKTNIGRRIQGHM